MRREDFNLDKVSLKIYLIGKKYWPFVLLLAINSSVI